MALTATCKKCNREVPPGEICPRCGTRLGKNAAHAAWVMERRPVADWMCWNAVMRWLLPAGLAVLLLALTLEGLSGGAEAVEALFLGGFPLTLCLLLGILLALVFLALLVQGKELLDYVVDSRGVHVTRYLPDPTPWKLLARGKSPALMSRVDPASASPLLRLEERDLPWREVARVQLWAEKCYLLFYAPAWWLRIPVRCTPFSWDDALFFVREKLGKKKAVDLPEHLRVRAARAASPRRARPAAAPVPAPSPIPPAEEPEAAPPDDPGMEEAEQLRMDLTPGAPDSPEDAAEKGDASDARSQSQADDPVS